MLLKEIRQNSKLSQQEAAILLNVSLRSYKEYENNPLKEKTMKYHYMCEFLSKLSIIDEEHGTLSIDKIKSVVTRVFERYEVHFCYLFGSYAKNNATPTSDIDLLIDTDITGLDFFGLVEELRNELCKKVDLLKLNQLDNNPELLREILKDGIKIYG